MNFSVKKNRQIDWKQIFSWFLQDIKSKWNEVKTLVPQRDQTLEDELRKQQNNEALRRQFADKSNQVGPWIERQMDAVAAIGMGMQVCNIVKNNNFASFSFLLTQMPIYPMDNLEGLTFAQLSSVDNLEFLIYLVVYSS